MAEDKYLEHIPFTWTGCNNKGVFPETDLIWDMMVISMLNHQADEFMEAVLGHHGSAKHLIRGLFSKTTLRNDSLSSQESSLIDRGVITPVSSDDGLPDNSTNDERDTLIRFKEHVLNHPSIQKDSCTSLAHLRHDSDSPFTFPASRNYWDRMRNISAVHTSCLYSWDWISCRMTSERGDEPFPTALTKYLSAELGQHLAVMCRMYNYYGSLARDKAEKNLNSVNSPEFENCAVSTMSSDATEKQTTAELQERKSALMEMAEYERERLVVKARLRPLVDERIRGVLDVFVNVTDLYGQIYVARDIASRMV
ncbi:hypothetical protein BOTCAL_0241g00010 [Botryotinia calthae]|uniref:Uncharacterized protein n=1 Tax=Botryotinia calthae TaxID=38488 RepID=A0A4Y8CX15_9HELO|nr:hypothetical protein BOTCAL_0241g00010 [Botryotinia calthae]